MNKKLAKLKKLQEDFEKKTKENGGAIIREAFDEYFAKYPEVEAVRFRSYIPGFNDGDVCEYTLDLYDPGIKLFSEKFLIGEYDLDDNYDDDSFTEKEAERLLEITEPYRKAFEEYASMFKGLKKIFQLSFGDNAKVTAYRDKYVVEDYDCGY